MENSKIEIKVYEKKTNLFLGTRYASCKGEKFEFESSNESCKGEKFEFESSNGTVEINRNGDVLPSSDLSDWLLDIQKVDVEELEIYLSSIGDEGIDDGDVLDFGFWDKKGNYNEPDFDWRLRVFNKQEETEEQKIKFVEDSKKWIQENRK